MTYSQRMFLLGTFILYWDGNSNVFSGIQCIPFWVSWVLSSQFFPSICIVQQLLHISTSYGTNEPYGTYNEPATESQGRCIFHVRNNCPGELSYFLLVTQNHLNCDCCLRSLLKSELISRCHRSQCSLYDKNRSILEFVGPSCLMPTLIFLNFDGSCFSSHVII